MANTQSPASSATLAVYQEPYSIFQNLTNVVKIRGFKFLINSIFRVANLPGLRDPSVLPTFTKVHLCQPKLENRIFISKSYKSEDGPLPTYLDLHGGGFALGHPCLGDRFCSEFSKQNNILVICLDYPKTLAHLFPEAINSVVESVKAVLGDARLPFGQRESRAWWFQWGRKFSCGCLSG